MHFAVIRDVFVDSLLPVLGVQNDLDKTLVSSGGVLTTILTTLTLTPLIAYLLS